MARTFDLGSFDSVVSRLEKAAPSVALLIRPFIEDIKTTIQYATSAGVTKGILFLPLMLGARNGVFKDGVVIEVTRKNNKRSDVLATGGRQGYALTK